MDTIRIYDDERISVENSKINEWKLIINRVNLNDDGDYSCRLSNGIKKVMNLKVGGLYVKEFINSSSIIRWFSMNLIITKKDN